MNPQDLLAPAAAQGSPAPYWLLAGFKVLGFILHMIPMNLLFAGILTALVMRSAGGDHAKRWAGRLMQQMPLFVALGVNFGIVPLLFMQVSYYRVFYPATILMAWPWISVIAALTVAYYGVYIYAAGIKSGHMTPLRSAAGWISSLLFIGIGWIFSNAMTLMTNVDAWPELWRKTNLDGAVLGTALNTGDPTLWPRWLMVFGLALMTTAAHVVVDAGLFGRSEGEDYRRWAPGFALRMFALGLVWFAATGAWYAFGTWNGAVRAAMLSGGLMPLTAVTALSPGLVLLALVAFRRGADRRAAWVVGAAQVAVIAVNAISRQVVQNIELKPFMDAATEPVNMQLSPLVAFLVTFAGGAALMAWMIRTVARQVGAAPPARS